MPGQLKEKIALVTGGSSGIGRAACVLFAREGATVVLASRREDESERTAQMVREAGGDALFVRTDVSQPSERYRRSSSPAWIVTDALTVPLTMQGLRE